MVKKNKNVIVALLALLIAGSVAVAASSDNTVVTGTWRYKVTVSVDTPEGIKTGSAVREVTVTTGYELTPESTADKDPKGEAVVVDLGKRGVLFALTGFDDYRTVFEAFPFAQGGTTAEGIKYYSNLKGAKATLTPRTYPMLAAFRDLSDVNSVTKVEWCQERATDGGCIKGELTDVYGKTLFGAGVALKEITIEMTDDAVTWGVVDKWLPWLQSLNGHYLTGKSSTGGELFGLHAGHFKTGERLRR